MNGAIAVASCAGHGTGADDEIRTRDIHLGKVVLYQLSYVRIVFLDGLSAGGIPSLSDE